MNYRYQAAAPGAGLKLYPSRGSTHLPASSWEGRLLLVLRGGDQPEWLPHPQASPAGPQDQGQQPGAVQGKDCTQQRGGQLLLKRVQKLPSSQPHVQTHTTSEPVTLTSSQLPHATCPPHRPHGLAAGACLLGLCPWQPQGGPWGTSCPGCGPSSESCLPRTPNRSPIWAGVASAI